ncbi:MAG TPA: substrate-binding domain-containing protein [Solirubrobacterales bacterium]|nr:substrate-binding domain-containing protein [Solirubrobacterales bacterium]
MRNSWVRVGRLPLLALLCSVICAVALSACGSSDSSSSSSGQSTGDDATGETVSSGGSWASSPEGKKVNAIVEELYEGSYDPPPKSGPPAQSGKTVWYISCGQEYEACVQQADAFKEAGSKLGWNVTVHDTKAVQQAYGEIIKQAIAAKVDGIATLAGDCPNMKSALEEAKDAGIPVVNYAGLDCDYEGFGGGEPLFTETLFYAGYHDFIEQGEAYARDRGIVAIQHMQGEGEILNLEVQAVAADEGYTRGFRQAFDEFCPDCEVIGVPFTLDQVPTKASQVWAAAIQSHPDADSLSNPLDAFMALGLKTTLIGADRDLWVIGAEVPPANLKLIEEGLQGAGLAVSGYVWPMWGMADTLNRVFAGSEEFPDEGGGWILVDKTHNMPPAGQQVEPPVDFKAAYEKVWNG